MHAVQWRAVETGQLKLIAHSCVQSSPAVKQKGDTAAYCISPRRGMGIGALGVTTHAKQGI